MLGGIASTSVHFVWDPKKANANETKHAVAFAEATMVFADPFAVTFPDPDHSLYEHRYITVGMSDAGRILIVSHTDREGDVRIISARKTTRSERKFYEEGT